MKKANNKKDQAGGRTRQFMLDVTHFHVETGMKYPSIGRKAIQDSRFWERLENGGTITLKKVDRVYDWMTEQGFNFNL